MNTFQKLSTIALLLPLTSFSGDTAQITDWNIENNGALHVIVDNESLYIEPTDKDAYYRAMMAARFQWPVEIVQNQLVIDIKNVPENELSLLSKCGEVAYCPYEDVDPDTYKCLLKTFRIMIEDGYSGKVTDWPVYTEAHGIAAFTLTKDALPNYKGDYVIFLDYSTTAENLLEATINTRPPKALYDFMWTMVDTSLAACRK